MTEYPDTNLMLGRLGVVYGQPDTPNATGFYREYARVLQQYTDSELDGGATRLLAGRKWKTWPTIAECVSACENERAAIRTRMAAEQNRERIAQQQAPKQLSQVELLEAQRFVDEWAAGRRSLLVPANAPPEKHIEMRLLSKRLRKLAVEMRARRGRVA